MKNLKPYFLLLILAMCLSCQNQNPDQNDKAKNTLPPEIQNMEVPFFITKDSLINPLKLQIVQAFQNLKFNYPVNPPIEGSWSFGLGNPQNGLKVGVDARPRMTEVVNNLPHTVNKPNWPFWYSRNIKITEPSILEIIADDGAQVFQDGELINPVNGNFYPIKFSPDSTRIDVRVLNNAMAGGLRSAAILSENEFGRQQNERVLEIFAQKLVHQAVNTPVLNQGVFNEVMQSLQKLTRSNQQKADRFFTPILIEPFLQKSGFSDYALMYERSSRTATKLDWMDVQRNIPNRFLCESQNEATCEVRTDLLEAGIPYDVTVSDNRAKVSFRVQAPTNKLKYSFSAWGDSQGNWPTFRKVVDQMSAVQDNFTIGLGDLVADGSKKEQWINFFHCLSPISKTTPLYMVAGNHDYDGFYNELIPYSFLSYIRNNNRNATFYSWRAPYAAFIVLDPNRTFPIGIDDIQMEWLKQELASEQWQSAQWRFLIIHQPPFAQAWEGYNGDDFIRDLMDQIAEPSRVDFVLSGHSHAYERLTKNYGTQQTTFLVMGGAGGALEAAASNPSPKMDVVVKQHHFGRFFMEDKKVSLEVYNLNGEVIDKYERTR